MMKVTVAMLRKLGACSEQVTKFKELFPEGVAITEAICLVHAQVFKWNWAAGSLLPPEARAEYNKAAAAARAEYYKATAAAWAEYDKAIAAPRAEYDKATAAAWAEYDKAMAAAWAEYYKAKAAPRAEYNKAKAAAFGRIAEAL